MQMYTDGGFEQQTTETLYSAGEITSNILLDF